MNDPESDRAWLADFISVPPTELTPQATEIFSELERSFPKIKIGRRKSDGGLYAYTIDPELGPMAIPLPFGQS